MVTRSRDVAVLRHGNVLFARVFKHCSLKTSDFKPLKCNKQQKRTNFAICTSCLRDTCMCKKARLCMYPRKNTVI